MLLFESVFCQKETLLFTIIVFVIQICNTEVKQRNHLFQKPKRFCLSIAFKSNITWLKNNIAISKDFYPAAGNLISFILFWENLYLLPLNWNLNFN